MNENESFGFENLQKNKKELVDFYDIRGDVLILFHQLNRNEDYRIEQKIFLDSIKKKHPDYENYELYYRTAGLKVPEKCSKFDFPGEDSVLKFYEKLLEKAKILEPKERTE